MEVYLLMTGAYGMHFVLHSILYWLFFYFKTLPQITVTSTLILLKLPFLFQILYRVYNVTDT